MKILSGVSPRKPIAPDFKRKLSGTDETPPVDDAMAEATVSAEPLAAARPLVAGPLVAG